MKVVVGADFNSVGLKNAIKSHLESAGHEVIDVGSLDSDQKKLFFDVVPDAAAKIQSGECERGILFCGTGMGMSLFANKFKGILAACCESVFSANKCRVINNANVLTMGSWIVGEKMACAMVDTFMNSELGEGLEDWRKKNVCMFYEKMKEADDKFR